MIDHPIHFAIYRSSFAHPSATVLLLLLRVETVVDLTVDPEEFSHLAARMSVGTFSVSYVVFELTLVDLSICPDELSPTIFDIV